ncbi:MAG: NUDIX domain-containing protein [Patescibacteria group bacterium]
MPDDQEFVKVGLGVIIENDQGQILIGKRIGDIAPYYSIPGGHVEPGETFEQTAVREIAEEVGLELLNPVVIAITNNLQTYQENGKHYISIIVHCTEFNGEPQNNEPHKCEGWSWVDPQELPEPHFDASKLGVKCYLDKCFYTKDL